MGVERTMYLGPYFEVRYPKVTRRQDICIRGSRCPDPQATNTNDFCSKCGIDLEKRVHHVLVREDFYELLEGETLRPGSEDEGDDDTLVEYLFPNLSCITPFGRDIWLEESQDLTDVKTKGEIRWMVDRYTKELAILTEKFGRENVLVKWGYITFWH